MNAPQLDLFCLDEPEWVSLVSPADYQTGIAQTEFNKLIGSMRATSSDPTSVEEPISYRKYGEIELLRLKNSILPKKDVGSDALHMWMEAKNILSNYSIDKKNGVTIRFDQIAIPSHRFLFENINGIRLFLVLCRKGYIFRDNNYIVAPKLTPALFEKMEALCSAHLSLESIEEFVSLIPCSES